VAQRPVILRKPGNAGGGKEPWFRTGAESNNASEIRATLVNSINVREMQKVSHTEAKEEPGLRAGKPVTAQVVALSVICITLDRCASGTRSCAMVGCNADDLSCAKACCLVREPDAVALHVRLDEEDVETE